MPLCIQQKEPLQNINSAAAPFSCLFNFRIRPHQPRLCFSRSSRTSRSVPSENASSVNASASGRVHREMARRMVRTEGGRDAECPAQATKHRRQKRIRRCLAAHSHLDSRFFSAMHRTSDRPEYRRITIRIKLGNFWFPPIHR